MSSIPSEALYAAAWSQPPRKVFIQGATRALTYGELSERLGRLFRWYRQEGLAAGDRVLLAVSDDIETSVLSLSLLLEGLVPVLLNPAAPAREIDVLRDKARPRAALVDANLQERWAAPLRELLVLPVATAAPRKLFERLFQRPSAPSPATSYPALLDALEPAEWPAPPPPEAPAYLLFTSGSTAQPKGVSISHGALRANLETFRHHFGYSEATRLMNLLPLYHADGIFNGPWMAFSCGATLLRPLTFQPQEAIRALDALYRHRATHWIAVPTMLAMVRRFAAEAQDAFAHEGFEGILSVAAQLEEPLWRDFEAHYGVRISNCYGLTETVSASLFCGPSAETRKLGTLGKPVDGEAEVVDGSGRPLPPGEVGELRLRGANLMTGYFEAPVATAGVLRDGWLYTGDLAHCDPEGFYHYVGRAKQVIISAGHNIYPEEVAEVLQGAPGVQECAVLGLPDPLAGERAVAAVTGENVQEEAVLAHCRAHLSDYKVPREVFVLPSLPRGPSGKVRLSELRAQLDASSRREHAAGAGALEARVLACAARAFRAEPATLNEASSPANTPGWDSLATVAFIVALEKEFSLRFAAAELLKLHSLGAANRLVQHHLESPP